MTKTAPHGADRGRRGERDLWLRFTASGDRDAREDLFKFHRPVAERMARRYSGISEPYDDLLQVASLGLVNAIDRFDPSRGLPFLAFAKPTIMGELKRHFRDKVWTVRVPRSVHDLILRVESVSAEFGSTLGRSPSVKELAERLGVEATDVLEALEAQAKRRPVPLDAPPRTDDGDDAAPEWIGEEDDGYARVDERSVLRSAVRDLTADDAELLRLRFVEELPQSRIAARLGCSQMHVSRRLHRTLEGLRDGVEGQAP